MFETSNGFGVMPGILVLEPSVAGSDFGYKPDFRFGNFFAPFCFIPISNFVDCNAPYLESPIFIDETRTAIIGNAQNVCVAAPIPGSSHTTLAGQCQGASMLVDNHCFAQALSSMVGGAWLDIDTVSLLVGAIGVNPIITGLFAITMGGVAAQAIWFVHSRKKKMNKIIPLFAFSILLLAPVGVQESFADHPDELGCPVFDEGFGEIYPGILVSGVDTGFAYEDQSFGSTFCYTWLPGDGSCEELFDNTWIGSSIDFRPGGDSSIAFGCATDPITVPHTTLADQCQGASILIDNHCFAQALNNIIGGVLLEINTIPLLVGAIGVNPIITGLVGITLAGVVGQTAWFVHRRRKSENS
jgi:hypothetical protein